MPEPGRPTLFLIPAPEKTLSGASIRVGEIMTREVVTVRPEASLQELAYLLSRHQISGAPVMDDQGALLGVVSHSDLADSMARGEDRATVADIMAPYVYCASEETGLTELADLMLEKRIHRVLVLREHRLVGLVSSLDLIRALRNLRVSQADLSPDGSED